MKATSHAAIGRPRPRFSPAEQNELLRIGLTKEQIRWLNHALGLIWDQVAPGPRANDVRDELAAMANALTSAEQRLRRWRKATAGLSAKSEALGHFNMAAAQHVRGPAPGSTLELSSTRRQSSRQLRNGHAARSTRHRRDELKPDRPDGGQFTIIAAIVERRVIDRILKRLGLEPQLPLKGAAREPGRHHEGRAAPA